MFLIKKNRFVPIFRVREQSYRWHQRLSDSLFQYEVRSVSPRQVMLHKNGKLWERLQWRLWRDTSTWESEINKVIALRNEIEEEFEGFVAD